MITPHSRASLTYCPYINWCTILSISNQQFRWSVPPGGYVIRVVFSGTWKFLIKYTTHLFRSLKSYLTSWRTQNRIILWLRLRWAKYFPVWCLCVCNHADGNKLRLAASAKWFAGSKVRGNLWDTFPVRSRPFFRRIRTPSAVGVFFWTPRGGSPS